MRKLKLQVKSNKTRSDINVRLKEEFKSFRGAKERKQSAKSRLVDGM